MGTLSDSLLGYTLNMFDVKLLLKFDCIALGRPTTVNHFTKCSTILLALMFRSGMASENLVELHFIVNRYSLPAFVFGSGPTQSIITLLKASSKAGMGCSGAWSIVLLGLPTTWYGWHILQCFATLPVYHECPARRNVVEFCQSFCWLLNDLPMECHVQC